MDEKTNSNEGKFILPEWTYKDFRRMTNDGGSFEAAFNRGEMAMKYQDYEGAIEDFSNAIKYKEDFWTAYYFRGKCYYSLEDYDRAFQDFKMAKPYYEAQSLLASYYADLGFMLGKLKRYSESIGNLLEAIRLYPNSKEYNYWCGTAFYELGYYREAILRLDQCLYTDDTYKEALYLKMVIYSIENKNKEAVEICNSIIKLEPNYALTYYNRGVLLARQGKSEEAWKDIFTAAKLGSDIACKAIEERRLDIQ